MWDEAIKRNDGGGVGVMVMLWTLRHLSFNPG